MTKSSPYLVIVLGVVIGVAAAYLLAVGTNFEHPLVWIAGLLLAIVASLMTLVSIIAAGVRYGMRLALAERS